MITTRDLLRIGLFTAVETIGLALWLKQTVSAPVLAALILFGFLAVEHVLNINTILAKPLFLLNKIKGILGFTFTETIAWILWLMAHSINPILAFVVLTIGLLVEHNQADNTARGRNFFGDQFNFRPLVHTLVEVVGGTAWLMLASTGHVVESIIVLFVALFIHHVQAARLGRMPK